MAPNNLGCVDYLQGLVDESLNTLTQLQKMSNNSQFIAKCDNLENHLTLISIAIKRLSISNKRLGNKSIIPTEESILLDLNNIKNKINSDTDKDILHVEELKNTFVKNALIENLNDIRQQRLQDVDNDIFYVTNHKKVYRSNDVNLHKRSRNDSYENNVSSVKKKIRKYMKSIQFVKRRSRINIYESDKSRSVSEESEDFNDKIDRVNSIFEIAQKIREIIPSNS
jgi:hypothetical protein